MQDHFNLDELLKAEDLELPLQTETALKFLFAPFESLFPARCVPADEAAAGALMTSGDVAREGLQGPGCRNDWIAWTFWEVRRRLAMAERFQSLQSEVAKGSPWWGGVSRKPLILFLREFRAVKIDAGTIYSSEFAERDTKIRHRVERRFPHCSVLWVANPRDALSYSNIVAEFDEDAASTDLTDVHYVPDNEGSDEDRGKNVSITVKFMVHGNADHDPKGRVFFEAANSFAYMTPPSEAAWLDCVGVLAQASDVIVMSNSNTEGGVGLEVDLLCDRKLTAKSYFTDPSVLAGRISDAKGVGDLEREAIPKPNAGRQRGLNRLPRMRHWAGPVACDYAGRFRALISQAWKRHHAEGKVLKPDTIYASLMAMAVLSLIRGDLAQAGQIHLDLYNLIREAGEVFHAQDFLTQPALLESGLWYIANDAKFLETFATR